MHMKTSENAPLLSREEVILIIVGLVLIAFCLGLAIFSFQFDPDIDLIERPVVPFVILMVSAGAVYLWAVVFGLRQIEYSRQMLLWILLIGALGRLLLFFSQPILEDDFYRYLWDGAVCAAGYNPYRIAPETVLNAPENVPPKLIARAREAPEMVSRINHPHIRTIYPPVTQGAFTLAYWIAPFSLIAWRLVLLLADVATVVLLLKILQAFNRPLLWIMIYWWNPLLIKVIFNTGHMDVLIFPWLLGSLLLVWRGRHLMATLLLAMACATKLWPIVLLPLILRPSLSQPRRLIAALALFSSLMLLMSLPVFLSQLDTTSGFIRYSQSWQNNDSLFKLIVFGWQQLLPLLGLPVWHDQAAARITTVILLTLWIVYCTYRTTAERLFESALWIVAGLFLLSPTQFPWYSTWFLPLLVIRPRFSLLLLSMLLPLYFLRFALEPRGLLPLFDWGVVWLEFVPVWLALMAESRGWRVTPAASSPFAFVDKT